jgi:dCMP deaminase
MTMSNDKWDTQFLFLARHIAGWSKDPSTKCGAVIADGRRIVSVGFNGFAAHTDDDPALYLDRVYKLEHVIHCEENAIIQAKCDVTGMTMFLTGAGCSRCTARLIQAGIMRVVIPTPEEDAFFYRGDWNASFEMAAKQLADADVELHVMEPTGYDAKYLMGPEHPVMKQIAEAKNEAVRRIGGIPLPKRAL